MKVNKNHLESLTIRLLELPSTIRCSLSNCPSNQYAKKGGEVLAELVSFRGELRLKKGCRFCGALYDLTVVSPRAPINQGEDELITKGEAAQMARVSKQTIDRLAKSGQLTARKLGPGSRAIVRFSRREVANYLGLS